MELLTSRALVERVQAYLADKLPLASLDQWIMENLEAFLQQRTSWDELALAIQLWVAELNQGHRDETEIRGLIQEFVDRHAVVIQKDEAMVFGSNNVISTPDAILAGQAGAVLQTVHI